MRLRVWMLLGISLTTLFGWAWSWAASSVATQSPAGPSNERWAALREELAADPGTTLASGTFGGHPWALRMFEDRSNAIDGAGPNLYIDSGGSYWLDRPDPGKVFDSIWHAEAGGAEVLVVVVATDDVVRVELRSGGRTWEAMTVRPDASAAFDIAFWVEATSEVAPFEGEIVAYDADGNVLQTRSFTTDVEAAGSG